MAESLPCLTGSYQADGAARDVFTLNSNPKSVHFVNLTTGATAEWHDTMPDATVVTHDSGTDAIDAAQGVTPDANGFSIGTNAVINTSGDAVHWRAVMA